MQKYVENKGKSVMYVGNTMIPPDEGKIVEVHSVRAAPAAAAPKGPNLVELTATLLALSVAQIVLELPLLTHEALDLAEACEQASTAPRKTLLSAIQTERIARADAKLQEGQAAAAEKALHDARNTLMAARLALEVAPAGSPAYGEAQAAVAEAQAKVDALAPAQG